jgi:hypothetical protein
MGEQPIKYEKPETTLFSNGIRLTGREWIVVAVFGLLFGVLAPRLWTLREPLALEPDFRMPHDLANDYWLYRRYADLAVERFDTILLGDSVVWGEYATPDETLSHYLNDLTKENRCVNLGLDGAHPLALEGLITHYARGVAGKNVLLQCNLLWMSSPRADLSDDEDREFNHPRLIPQFLPRIPRYKEDVSPRIGVEVERRVELSSWTNHLQQAYYDHGDIPSWTLEHPYENPLEPLTRSLPSPDKRRRHPDQPWYESGITPQDYPWIDMNSSLQWQAFQRTVRLLRQRGNRVFVLVGPFNEHLLTPDSRRRFQEVKAVVTTWLQAEGLPNAAPAALPSAEYGDASHPLAAGYRRLAGELLDDPFFQSLGLKRRSAVDPAR